MTKVKYCGLRNERDIQLAMDLNIDYVGFVVVPTSKRFVTVEQIVEFCNFMASHDAKVEPVLVVMDFSEEEIVKLTDKTQVFHVQLAGNEPPELCRNLKEKRSIKVWKSWHVASDAKGDVPEEETKLLASYLPVIDGLLLDTSYKGIKGGTGTVFHWQAITTYQSMVGEVPLIVAGGLHQDNVKTLIDHYHPFAVDVSSGIEQDGRKDPAKMKDFASRVREANHETGRIREIR